MNVLDNLGMAPNSVIVLMGCAGSGKSSAAAMFPPSWVLSADALREQVSDDAGNQDASEEAWTLLHLMLEARLGRGLPAVVDATNTQPWVRRGLLVRAGCHQAPVTALVLDTPLDVAQARNRVRPVNRRVPEAIVAEQHAQLSAAHLLTEGFAHVVTAGELPVLATVLRRLATVQGRTLGEVEAVFGYDLAALFTWDEKSHDLDHQTGTIAAGGQEMRLRWVADGDPFDNRFEAQVPCDTAGCPGPAWTVVHSLAELQAAYEGCPEDEALCDICD